MKRFLAITLSLAAIFSLTACGGNETGGMAHGDSLPTPSPTAAPGGAPVDKDDGDSDVPTPSVPPIPPDSIWVLKGEVEHRQVLEEGYYADYTVELDFVKLDGAYPFSP